MIRKEGSWYVLRSKRTKRALGYHKTRAGAKKQERAIQLNKRKRRKHKEFGGYGGEYE